MCVSHSNGIIVVQSGGRTSRETEVLKKKQWPVACKSTGWGRWH